jgi:hypothetical protein
MVVVEGGVEGEEKESSTGSGFKPPRRSGRTRCGRATAVSAAELQARERVSMWESISTLKPSSALNREFGAFLTRGGTAFEREKVTRERVLALLCDFLEEGFRAGKKGAEELWMTACIEAPKTILQSVRVLGSIARFCPSALMSFLVQHSRHFPGFPLPIHPFFLVALFTEGVSRQSVPTGFVLDTLSFLHGMEGVGGFGHGASAVVTRGVFVDEDVSEWVSSMVPRTKTPPTRAPTSSGRRLFVPVFHSSNRVRIARGSPGTQTDGRVVCTSSISIPLHPALGDSAFIPFLTKSIKLRGYGTRRGTLGGESVHVCSGTCVHVLERWAERQEAHAVMLWLWTCGLTTGGLPLAVPEVMWGTLRKRSLSSLKAKRSGGARTIQQDAADHFHEALILLLVACESPGHVIDRAHRKKHGAVVRQLTRGVMEALDTYDQVSKRERMSQVARFLLLCEILVCAVPSASLCVHILNTGRCYIQSFVCHAPRTSLERNILMCWSPDDAVTIISPPGGIARMKDGTRVARGEGASRKVNSLQLVSDMKIARFVEPVSLSNAFAIASMSSMYRTLRAEWRRIVT